jgi:hypothetical protein
MKGEGCVRKIPEMNLKTPVIREGIEKTRRMEQVLNKPAAQVRNAGIQFTRQ